MRALIGFQVLWLAVLVLVLRPVGTGLQSSPVYTDIQQARPSEQLSGVEANFGDGLILKGYDWSHEVGATVTLNLHWTAQKTQSIPYYFSILPVGPDGKNLPPIDWQPFDTHYPDHLLASSSAHRGASPY